MKSQVIENRKQWDKLTKTVASLKGGNAVDIGVFGEQGSDLVIYASANEFGAKINHPGGTTYGYLSKKDAISGKVSFMKAGAGFMSLGVTKPHVIKIPERSYLRSTFDEEKPKMLKQIDKAKVAVVLGKITKDKFLNRLGLFFSRKVIEKIDYSKEWADPNAPSTIAAKSTTSGKGDQPLFDTGRLRQSITYKIVT